MTLIGVLEQHIAELDQEIAHRIAQEDEEPEEISPREEETQAPEEAVALVCSALEQEFPSPQKEVQGVVEPLSYVISFCNRLHIILLYSAQLLDFLPSRTVFCSKKSTKQALFKHFLWEKD